MRMLTWFYFAIAKKSSYDFVTDQHSSYRKDIC